jgi:anaerobic magnesium-protoporphyrin IX monomethyl ester cyclase
VPIVLGGYHASLAHRAIAEDPEAGVDFIVRGEGEETFRELVDALSGRGDVSSIRGLSYRKDGVFVHNPDRPLLPLAQLPLPDRASRIWGGYNVFGRPFDFIESSRGCSLTCSFCSITRHYGRGQRVYSIPRVLEDARAAAARGTEQLFFVDDNITLDPDRFEKLLDAFIESPVPGLTYSTQTSVDGLYDRPVLIEKMVRAGFALIYVGVENMSRRNLEYFKKGDISQKTGWVLDRLHRAGVIVMGGFIIGTPEDTREDIVSQFEFMRRAPIDGFLIQVLTPYPGTPLTGELEAKGYIVNRDLRRYSGFFANVRTDTLSSRELDFLRWKHTPYFRSPGWFLRSRAMQRYARPLFRTEGFRRVGEFFSEHLSLLFRGEERTFLKYCEEHLNSNRFFGEPRIVPSWPDAKGD